MKTKDGEEYGSMSEIRGIVANKPRNIRGERVKRLMFEEAGSNPILTTSWVQGEALITRAGRRSGCRFAWGTGGDSGPSLQGLAEMFNNPEIFGALPCRHNHTAGHETVYTGFFFPAYRMHFDYIDPVRGVTDEEKARADFETRRNAKLDNPQAYLEYCSEYCFTPDEALVRQGENQFNQVLLAEQLANITIHKITPKPIRGCLMGGNRSDDGSINALVWKPDMTGDILIMEEPERDASGAPIKNLYCAGIDSIDMGKNDSTGQMDVSDFCIVIMKRHRGTETPKIVAIYKDRPNDIRFSYDTAFRLLDWYNAKCVLENSRTNIITYAREKKKLHYFLTRPKATITNLKTNTTMIGAPPTEGVVRHYLELIESFINDYAHDICYVEVIEELMKYTYENKRKFDIVAAFGMCLLADEDLFAAPIESVVRYSQEWRDIGYYTDNDGKRRFGAVPNRQQIIKQNLGGGWQ